MIYLGEAMFCKKHCRFIVLSLSLKKLRKCSHTALKVWMVLPNDTKFSLHNLALQYLRILVLTLVGE